MIIRSLPCNNIQDTYIQVYLHRIVSSKNTSSNTGKATQTDRQKHTLRKTDRDRQFNTQRT